MRRRPVLLTVTVALALAAAALVACGDRKSEAPSGVSTATPAASAVSPRASGSPAAPPATPPGSDVEAALTKALLQRGDVPGGNWTVQDIGAQQLAALTQSGQAGAQDLQGLVSGCYPGQPTPGSAATPGVARAFVTQAPNLSMVISSATSTPDAAKAVESMRTLKVDAARACIEGAMTKGMAGQMPGATVRLSDLERIEGLPAHAAGFTMALRISAGGVTLTQHLATISAAQGQVFASTVALSMGEGTTVPALPIAADRLGALTAQRVSEAAR